MSETTPGIHLEDVRCRLGSAGQGVAVEFHLDALAVAPGERIALVGPSGCGKSTLLNIIGGLVNPSGGVVRVLGEDLRRLGTGALDRFRGREVGFVFQSFNLLEAFSALDNVLVGWRFGRRKGSARRESVAMLERVGLGHRVHALPSRLSVGERQRVAIARALVAEPRLLLADEPTGSLDPATAAEVFALLESVATEPGPRGPRTLIMVTHDPELAGRFPRTVDCRGLIRSGGAPA